MKRYLYTFTLKIFCLVMGLIFMSCGGGSGDPGDPPAKPENLRAEASDGQVTLTWTVEDGVSYDLYYSRDAGFKITDPNVMSMMRAPSPYTHTGLREFTTYYYKLTAMSSLGTSEPTDEVSATTRLTSLKTTVSSGQVKLTWDEQTGVTYGLYHSVASGFTLESGTEVSPVSSPHSHTGLTDFTTYYYRLTSSAASEPTEEIWAAPPVQIAISAGGSYTCAVVGGAAKCWGSGLESRLGRGSNSGAAAPVNVSGLTTGVTDISAGSIHTCAVVNGGAFCWGNGGNGRLGDGVDYRFAATASTPVQVNGLTSGFTDISAGSIHTCAVVNGGAFCWGDGGSGQLGIGHLGSSNTPLQVSGLASGVTQISVGNVYSCAVVNGGAFCWGSGGNGRLGDGMTMNRTTPVQVMGLTSGVTHISAGNFHTCAVVNGGAFCWGKGSEGQIGDGMTMNRTTPVQVAGLTSGVTQIAAGLNHTCALMNGEAWCWGAGGSGQLGRGNSLGSNTPQQVMGLTNRVTQISVGLNHTCAVLVNARAKCWGGSEFGQIGDGMEIQRNTPVQVHDDIYD